MVVRRSCTCLHTSIHTCSPAVGANCSSDAFCPPSPPPVAANKSPTRCSLPIWPPARQYRPGIYLPNLDHANPIATSGSAEPCAPCQLHVSRADVCLSLQARERAAPLLTYTSPAPPAPKSSRFALAHALAHAPPAAPTARPPLPTGTPATNLSTRPLGLCSPPGAPPSRHTRPSHYCSHTAPPPPQLAPRPARQPASSPHRKRACRLGPPRLPNAEVNARPTHYTSPTRPQPPKPSLPARTTVCAPARRLRASLHPCALLVSALFF